MATQQQSQSQSDPGLPFQQGVLYGALAFGIGYALSYLYLFVGTSDFLDAQKVSDNTLQIVGWVFFNAQFVEVELDQTAATSDVLGGLAASQELELPAVLLTFLIGVLLLAAGYRVADAVRGPRTTTDEGSVYGATIVAGYLPIVFFGALLFEVSDIGRPDMFGAVILAGLIFPAFLGAIGGHLAVSRNTK